MHSCCIFSLEREVYCERAGIARHTPVVVVLAVLLHAKVFLVGDYYEIKISCPLSLGRGRMSCYYSVDEIHKDVFLVQSK